MSTMFGWVAAGRQAGARRPAPDPPFGEPEPMISHRRERRPAESSAGEKKPAAEGGGFGRQKDAGRRGLRKARAKSAPHCCQERFLWRCDFKRLRRLCLFIFRRRFFLRLPINKRIQRAERAPRCKARISPDRASPVAAFKMRPARAAAQGRTSSRIRPPPEQFPRATPPHADNVPAGLRTPPRPCAPRSRCGNQHPRPSRPPRTSAFSDGPHAPARRPARSRRPSRSTQLAGR